MSPGRWVLVGIALILTVSIAGCLGDDGVALDQLAQGQGLAVTVTPEEGTVDETFTFDASATPHADELTFTWDFGDDTNATGTVVEHQFAWDNHTYDVTVTASNGTDTLTGTVQVPVGSGENTPPTITVSADKTWVAHDEPLTLDAEATDPDGDPVTVTWLLAQRHEGSDGETAYGLPDETGKTGTNATFSFEESGTYKIVGEAEDAKGTTVKDHVEVKVTRTVPRTTFSLVEEGTLTAGTAAGVTGFSVSEMLYDIQQPSQNTYIDAARYDATLLYSGQGTLSLDWADSTAPADLELLVQDGNENEVVNLQDEDPTTDRLETEITLDAGEYTLFVRANAGVEVPYTLALELDLEIPGLTDA